MQIFPYENEFDLHEIELVGELHNHKNGFALRLALTQRQTRTRKWALLEAFVFFCSSRQSVKALQKMARIVKYDAFGPFTVKKNIVSNQTKEIAQRIKKRSKTNNE